MSDVMFYGVLRMPYEIAMADEMSRFQFYSRVQEAVDRVEKAEAKLAAIEAATEQGKPQPLTDEQVQKILFQVQINWAKSPPTHEFAPAFARAIEAAHGITATPQGKI